MYLIDLLQDQNRPTPWQGDDAFRKIVQLSPYIIHIHRADTWQLVFANRQLTQALGYDAADLERMDYNLLPLIADPGQRDRIRNAKGTLSQLPPDEVREYTLQVRHKNDALRMFNTRVSVFKADADGKPLQIMAMSEDVTAAHEAAAKLRESEMLLSETERMLNYGSWEWMPDEKTNVWTEGVRKIFGWEALPDDSGEQFRRTVHPDDLHRVDRANQEAYLEKKPFEIQFRAYKPDGSEMILLSRGRAVEDENGRVRKVVGSVAEITAQKKALRRLVESEMLLSESETLLNCGSWALDVATHTSVCSENMYCMLGWTKAENQDVIQMLRQGIHPDDLERVQQTMRFAIVHQEPYAQEFRFIRPDGSQRILATKGKPIRNADGNIETMLGSTVDVTEQRRLLDGLRKSEAMLAEAEHLFDMGSWERDLATGELKWTDGQYRLFGMEPGTPVSTEIFKEMIAPDEYARMMDVALDAIGKGQPFDVEYNVTTQNGTKKIISGRGRPIFDEAGRIIKMTGSDFDITAQKNATRRIVQSEALLLETEKILDYGSWAWDVKANTVTWSENMWRLFGYDPAAETGRELPLDFYLRHVHPDDLESVTRSNTHFMETGLQAEDYEHRIIMAGGTVRVVTGKARIVSFENGKPAQVVGATINLTEQKSNMGRLKESEALLSEAEQMLDYGSCSWDIANGKVMWSDGLWRLLGYDPEQEQRRHVSLDFYLDHIHPEDRQVALDRNNQILAGNSLPEAERRMIRCDGRQITVITKSQVVAWRDGRPSTVVGSTVDITEQRQSLQKLLESEELLRESEKVFQYGSWIIDVETGQMHWSSGLWHLLGFAESDIARAKVQQNHDPAYYDQFVHPEDLEIMKRNTVQMMETGVFESTDHRLTTLSGRVIIANAKGKSFQVDGKTKVVGSVTDVTEDRRMAESLRQSERVISENERVYGYGSFEWMAENGEAYWSDGTMSLYGLDPLLDRGRLTSGNGLDLLDARDRDRAIDTINQAVAQRQPYEVDYRVMITGGQERWLRTRGTPEYNADGSLRRIYGTVNNVTNERRALEKLLESEELLSESEQILNYGSWSWDVAANTVTWSAGLWRMLGYDSDEYKGQPVPIDFYMRHIHPEDVEDSNRRFEQSITIGQMLDDGQHRLIRKDGRMVTAISRQRVVSWQDGKPTKIVGSTADITYLKSIQSDLEQKNTELQRSNTELERFAYVASHDLQEPLRKITTFGSRLVHKNSDALNDEGKLYLDRMMNASRRMSLLIENLLGFSRLSRKIASFAETDLNQIVKNVTGDLEIKIEEVKAKVTFDELPVIEAEPQQINQLFANLIGNALKFTRTGIAHAVHVRHQQLTNAEKQQFGLSGDRDYHRIVVEDNGIGFELECAEEIFVVFQRLHGNADYEGTGIGLAICKKIAENHGGLIFADGYLGEGAKFTVVLPVRQKPDAN